MPCLLYFVAFGDRPEKFSHKYALSYMVTSFQQSAVVSLLKGTNKGVRSLLEESLIIAREMLREAQLAYPRNPVRDHNLPVSFIVVKLYPLLTQDFVNIKCSVIIDKPSLLTGPPESKIQDS